MRVVLIVANPSSLLWSTTKASHKISALFVSWHRLAGKLKPSLNCGGFDGPLACRCAIKLGCLRGTEGQRTLSPTLWNTNTHLQHCCFVHTKCAQSMVYMCRQTCVCGKSSVVEPLWYEGNSHEDSTMYNESIIALVNCMVLLFAKRGVQWKCMVVRWLTTNRDTIISRGTPIRLCIIYWDYFSKCLSHWLQPFKQRQRLMVMARVVCGLARLRAAVALRIFCEFVTIGHSRIIVTGDAPPYIDQNVQQSATSVSGRTCTNMNFFVSAAMGYWLHEPTSPHRRSMNSFDVLKQDTRRKSKLLCRFGQTN